jgi:hypothetical protein
MSRLDQAGKDLELQRARLRARVGKVPAPEQILSDLHNIPFSVGEKVYDSVTGLEVEVLGVGVRNVETSD